MAGDEPTVKVGAGRTAPSPPSQPSGPLPQLREELTLHPGPMSGEGGPTWSLQDPVRNQFFRIDWTTFEILARWHLENAPAVIAAVSRQTTLDIDDDDIVNVIKFLTENELLRVDSAAGSRRFTEIAKRRKAGWGKWLLHHYLFFRVPLFRPDPYLERLLRWVAPLYTDGFLKMTLAALLLGLIAVARQWEQFSATLIDTFSWQGLAGYGMALVFVKVLHEFGHALTAKRCGCRVPVMGVAFLVMWPMAYTDVNEIWKLPDRRRRLMVSGAGIATELGLAAWATLAWALLPDGTLRGVAFMLCTTTWISTIAINASPFMRFDGYFLLCDWLDMPNLHQRSFALARWHMREALFGLGDPPPEYLPPARHKGLIVFAYVTWLYRLIIFLGIAAMVYDFFVKLLGLFLFVIEIAWFVVLPAWSEIKVWHERKDAILKTSKTRRTLLIFGSLLMLTVIPWQFQVEAQGVLRPAQRFPLVTPAASRVVALPLAHGDAVAAGKPLLHLESPELMTRRSALRQRVEVLRWQVAAASFDPELMPRQQVLTQEFAGTSAELAGVEQEISRLNPVAPFAGTLRDLPPDLRVGQWVGRNIQMATLIGSGAWRVETFLPERELERVKAGDWGRFIAETPGGENVWLEVERVDRDVSRVLTESMLSSIHGGEILSREKNNALIPEQALYRVSLRVIGNFNSAQALRGKVVIFASPKTLAGGFFHAATGLVIREAGF
jgi:putative peptide zinc metalloprotease protein